VAGRFGRITMFSSGRVWISCCSHYRNILLSYNRLGVLSPSPAKPPRWANPVVPLTKLAMHLKCCFSSYFFLHFKAPAWMPSVSFTARKLFPR
jgi:hypothetical protein